MLQPTQLPLILLALSYLPITHAQQAPDGVIVPFTSGLPSCASQCGPLYDVQGGCVPPITSTVDQSCFCTDTRLKPFVDSSGTTGVSTVCGAASCTSAADLEAVKDWYQGYCDSKSTATTVSSTPGSTATGKPTSTPKPAASGQGQTWLQGHYKWVIMLVVLFAVITGVWVGACLWRKRYIRNKEKEFELRPPVVAWGPHQHQNMTGGYNYGDGIVDGAGTIGRGTPGKIEKGDLTAMATPADGGKGKRESKGWLRKSRRF